MFSIVSKLDLLLKYCNASWPGNYEIKLDHIVWHRWTGLEGFNSQARTPLYCNSNSTGGFVKKYKNLSFYWVLKAGRNVSGLCIFFL